ncbi:MAG: enoyl-CoA hydratase-related protein [Sphingomonadaceae bacterium]
MLTLTFNRVDKKNSITAAMYAAMADALAAADKDANVRVAIIQGAETIFSAGNDIGDFLDRPPSTPESAVFRFLHGIAGFSKPIIAEATLSLALTVVPSILVKPMLPPLKAA